MTDSASRRPQVGWYLLSMYYNGYDYVIAESRPAAAAFIALHFGERTPESKRADDLQKWECLAYEELIPLTMADGFIVELGTAGSQVVSRPVEFWVQHLGAGYVASSQE